MNLHNTGLTDSRTCLPQTNIPQKNLLWENLLRTNLPQAKLLWTRACAALSVIFLLSACVSTGQVQNSADPDEFASISDPKARRQLQSGDIQGAADTYTKRASRESDPLKQQDYLLIAAEILFDRAMTVEGFEKLKMIPELLDGLDLQQRRDIVVAKNALYNGNPEQALEFLPDPSSVESSLHRARVFEVRAQSFRQLLNPDEELLARIALEEQLQRQSIIEANHQQIWQLLTTQPLSVLGQMTTNVRGNVYQGWIELALANASSGTDPEKRQKNLELWRTRYTGHPAESSLAKTLYDPASFVGVNVASGPIRQVGVLLPLSAQGIGQAAEAIRDGIMIAYQNAPDQNNIPEVKFYDIGENVEFVRTAFQNAVADGADAIIGPLRKQAVSAIVTQRDIPVPVLTLNTIEVAQSSGLQNVIQFGLAPEDEARSAARRALGLSYRNAIVFQTDDSRGDRESRAFSEFMLQNGGDVVHTATLPQDEYDYSKQIKDALLITQSDQRFRSISRTIDSKLFFEPSIRGDVDVVFLALDFEQARSVRPQLAFFRAGKLPMLATSRVAPIDDDRKANRDLNGINYADTPWLLDKKMKSDPLYQQATRNFPDGMDVFSKLYALGIDAWNIVNNLQQLTDNPSMQIPGYTGNLSLTADGRIERQLIWAKYEDGLIKRVKNVDFSAPSLQPRLQPIPEPVKNSTAIPTATN